MRALNRLTVRAERGFSMFLAIMAMLLTAMFVAAAFAAANGDLPVSGISKDRKSTYAAAEAGLNFYLNHLQQDSDYWTLCDQVPAPNESEPNPVSQQFDGVGSDKRRWRTIPGSSAQYTIEVLHTKNYTKCETDPKKQDSVIDLNSGTFKVRATGRPRESSTQRRAIVATFRRAGFLNFIYFTSYETLDPQAFSTKNARDTAEANCANRYRKAREGKNCTEIQFVSGDEIKGPLHTNDDSLLICGTPTFGRPGRIDTVEVTGDAPGYIKNGTSCSASPTINSPTKKVSANSQPMEMPTSNEQLADVAESGGTVYFGKTIVRLKTTGTMDVTNYNAAGVGTTTTNVPWPVNGVLYVRNNGACATDPPTAAAYNEASTCGNIYVSGTYSRSLTIAAANDVIIAPTNTGKLHTGSKDANLVKGDSDATLGLIANNFVRVWHPVTRSGTTCKDNVNTSADPVVTNVTIDAAVLSLQHSFIVDNYDCGKLGDLKVTGAIAQKYRGPVGTGSGTNPTSGFLKDYTYDDRFRYRSPPYFMNPIDATWDVIRSHEQVPAR
ncbi:MAG TPA: hypothetical protein VNS09_15360 [Solirubrobacter sp.]|nr:hypothetical protein [Solirubrobacter sp.]